jgi:hypothetical protein
MLTRISSFTEMDEFAYTVDKSYEERSRIGKQHVKSEFPCLLHDLLITKIRVRGRELFRQSSHPPYRKFVL